MHCASLTEHNKMAAVKRACEVTLLKWSWLKRNAVGIFLPAVVSYRGETQCVGNMHNVSSMRVAEFDFLTENLDTGWLTCAYSLSLSHCVLNVISRCKFCKNGFFTTFVPLSHTFYFETRPSPLSKIEGNAFGAHFLQLYRKNEYGDPHFLFHDFNKYSASFRWEKNRHKSMFSYKLYRLSHHGSNSAFAI